MVLSEWLQKGSVPLPRIVKNAASEPRVGQNVEHKVMVGKAKENVKLRNGNHTFYLGKAIKDSTGRKIKKTLGFVNPENETLYNEDLITSLLDYAFKVVEPGQKVRIALANVVSELFNGNDYVKGFMSYEEERKLIYKIAKEKFGKNAEDLSVVDLSKDARYVDLVKVLKFFRDPQTGAVDVDMALGGKERFDESGNPDSVFKMELPEKPTALELAEFLYWATQRNEDFAEEIFKLRPEKIKNDKASLDSSKYYGLFEIAQRLTAILDGEYYHGGADRQERYDKLIQRLIKGSHGSFSHVPELKPLFAVIDGKRFEVLHVDGNDNYYRDKTRIIAARTRLALYAALGLAAIGSYQGVEYHEEKIHKVQVDRELDAIIIDALRGVEFHGLDGWMKPTKSPENIHDFKEVLKSFQDAMVQRYRIPEADVAMMRERIIEFLLKKSELLSNAHNSELQLFDLIDKFVEENKLFFKARDLNIADHPYAWLDKYREDFLRTAALGDLPMSLKDDGFEENFAIDNTYKLDYLSPSIGKIDGLDRRTYDGSYSNFSSKYLLRTNDHPKFGRLVYGSNAAWAPYRPPVRNLPLGGGSISEEHRKFTLKEGIVAAQIYKNMLMRRSVLDLRFSGLYDDMINTFQNCNFPRNFSSSFTDEVRFGKNAIFKDPFGGFEYEFGRSYFDIGAQGNGDFVITARLKGEEEFTTERAFEGYKKFHEYYDGSKFDSGFQRCLPMTPGDLE